MFFDSHAHLDAFEKPEDVRQALDRARAAHVDHILAVGGHSIGNALALKLAGLNPGFIHAAIGFDRDQTDFPIAWDQFEQELSAPGVVALGEIGLDYHYLPEKAEAQKKLFGQMLELARKKHLPIVVHSRNAEADTLALLEEHVRGSVAENHPPGVLHCFTGSLSMAQRVLELGMMVSFSGIITFGNASELREVARQIPAEALLIETDTPYLAPEPYRGRRNEPGYLPRIAEALANIRNDTVENIAHITTENAKRLLGTP